jgi:betaine-aldehyde dehydrogenase
MDTTGLQFIAGKRRSGTSGHQIAVTNPATGDVLTTDTLAGPDDVNEAAAAARDAFTAWSRTTPADRSEALLRWAGQLEARSEEFAQTESRIGGKPIKLTRGFDVPGTIDNVRFFAGAARNLEGRASAEYSGEHTSAIRREPIGVIGSIAPWNYPLQMAARCCPTSNGAGSPRSRSTACSSMYPAAASRPGPPVGHAAGQPIVLAPSRDSRIMSAWPAW